LTGSDTESVVQRDRLTQYLVTFAGDVLVYLDGLPGYLDRASAARGEVLRARAHAILCAARGFCD
jgi:hypothetical protein